jgi:ferredoxin like protein
MENRLDEKLATLAFKTDPDPHIVIEEEKCPSCASRPCIVVCPANLYLWEGDHIVHTCEGCLECGSCRIICPQGAITWHYPRGGYGVHYRWG